MRLLISEWQSYGLSPAPADGARRLAEVLFAGRAVTEIESPRIETLVTRHRVLGLDSIAARFRHAIDTIRRAQPDRLLTIAGTCGAELAPIAYLNERYGGDLVVIWLDGHADLNTPASSPSQHFHGMVLRTLVGEGAADLIREIARPLETRQIALAGARDLDPPEVDFVRASGIVHGGTEIFAAPDAFLDRLPPVAHAYVHFDLDVINPDDFAPSLMATAGGPTLDRAAGFIRAVHGRFHVVGMSVVEFTGQDDESRDRLCGAVEPFFA